MDALHTGRLINATSRPSGRIKVLGSQRIPVTLIALQSTFEWQESTNRIIVQTLVLAGGMFAPEYSVLISSSRASCKGSFQPYSVYIKCAKCEKDVLVLS